MISSSPSETIIALSAVADALEHLHIRYYIGGSIASGAWGEFRATNDIDIFAISSLNKFLL